ncbi:uncharacterized protein F5891DRAFT_975565 [Suillus fuscotomentosus]|uniref:DUF6589 domain-containing protein n=1 Tax=Suillus fuscotomentosus TaxID=1912939 RepID=A0AAD4EH99_9AGAM|nr:uncharacterized protein F5891DRAFT_975565 [Suillus fuscotomentosus]KAG1906110.1 hypothetical protein F5891DRAFT_975565 [Suillus fuscotomentosus]
MHTPQRVIETLLRMGVSVSVHAINAAITSLSAESRHAIQALGQTLLAAYAYDNFDVDLKKTVHTHGVTCEDLQCSSTLWENFPLNPHVNASTALKDRWKDLLNLHSDPLDATGLSHQDCFNSWKMLSDLVNFGPPYFHQFKNQLCNPGTVEAIPVIKTPILAVRVMHVCNSTVSDNICSVVELLQQGGIEDPVEIDDPDTDMLNMSEYVILFHGDLGTGEHLLAAQQRGAIEATRWKRFQHVIFIPSLFHLKMASADAIWRIFLQPISAWDDDSVLMQDIGMLRPKETGIYGSKPVEAKKHNSLHTDLDAFTASEPSFDDLKTMADQLAHNYIANHRTSKISGIRNTKSWYDESQTFVTKYEDTRLTRKLHNVAVSADMDMLRMPAFAIFLRLRTSPAVMCRCGWRCLQMLSASRC